jgi:hypothetical protein
MAKRRATVATAVTKTARGQCSERHQLGDVKFGVIENPKGSVPAQLKYAGGELKYVLCANKDGLCEKKKSMYTEDGHVVEVCVEMGNKLKDGLVRQTEDLPPVKLYQRRPSAPFVAPRSGSATSTNARGEVRATISQEVQIDDVLAFIKACYDEAVLKLVKKAIIDQIKAVLAGRPQKSYQIKIRNGKRYYYQIWWDRVAKKKVTEYYGTKPPKEMA